MSSISRFLNCLYCWIYNSYIYCIKTWIKFFRYQIGLLVHFETQNHTILLALICFIRYTSRCHSFLLIVICCLSVSFVFTRCTTLCHSLYHWLSVVVTPYTTRFHSMYHSLSLDVPLVCLFINHHSHEL